MPWLNFLLPAASALIGAAKGGPSRTSTDQTTTSSGSSATSGTGSSRRYLSPDQEALMGGLGAYIRQMMENPEQVIAPARGAAIDGINRNFMQSNSITSKSLASNGNKSGRGGRMARESELARLGEINDANVAFDMKGFDLQQIMAQMGLNFANINLGSDTNYTGQSSQQGTSRTVGTSTGTQPGGRLGGALGGGLETLSYLLQLQKLMDGGGSGGGDVSSNHPGFWGG